MNANMQAVYDMFRDVESITIVRPCRVTIGRQTSEGFFYGQLTAYKATEWAVTEGPCKEGDKHMSYRFYLLGEKPPTLGQRPRVVLTWTHGLSLLTPAEVSIGEWYYSGGFQCLPENTPYHKYHPGGSHFDLHEWTVSTYGYYKDWKIDTEEKPRPRKPMKVEWLAERE